MTDHEQRVRDRWRGPLYEARLIADGGNAITHVLGNMDGTYSVMGHIVCEHCDHCDTQGDCRGKPDAQPVTFKDNPYENQED